MGCSINIIRKVDPICECKWVDIRDELSELDKAVLYAIAIVKCEEEDE